MTNFGRALQFALLPAVLAAGAAPLHSQGMALRIDPDRTQVQFTLGALLHTVHGTFRLKRGEMRFDPATGSAAGELVVDAASGETGNATRDKRMRQDVLETDRYPEIVFRPDRVSGQVAAQGASHARLHGSFSIHGTDHEIEMPVDVEAGDGQYRATIQFSVPYVQWGMKDPSALLLRVDKRVDLVIHAVARVIQ